MVVINGKMNDDGEERNRFINGFDCYLVDINNQFCEGETPGF
jgi:hypothetical protein